MQKQILFLLLFTFIKITSYTQTAESAYKTGMLLKENGKSNDAIIEFNKAVKLDPKSYKSIYELGWCYNDLKQYSKALENLKKIRPHWRYVPKVFFEMGYAFEKTNQKDSARLNYNECLKLKSDYKLAHKYLGNLEYDAENYNASILHYNNYIALDPTAGNDYKVWYNKGFAENTLKNYNDAILSLNKSKTINGKNLNTFLELGYAYTKLKMAKPAIDNFTIANSIDKTSHIPYNGIGEVYRDIYKKMDSAIIYYKAALNVKANERKACFGIGYCLNAKGIYSEAIPYLQTAVKQEPTYTAAYVELGYAYLKLEKFNDALTNFDKALSLNSKSENAMYYKGLLYISKKDKIKAQQMLTDLNNIGSKNASLLQEKINKI